VVPEARVRGRLVAVAAVAALAVVALPGTAAAAGECNGIPRCITVEGPWVAVPARGEVWWALECPNGGRGLVAGTDARASSLDIRASFDGILGSPVSFGRTTNTEALFRGVSAHHRVGSFKPFIGCIPSPNSLHTTTAAQVTPTGPPFDLRMKVVPLDAGFQKTVTLSCPGSETLVDSWSATAFTTPAPPRASLASAVRVKTTIVGERAQLAISASEALPRGSGAEVQIGVRCATI
jgi:hypothetical protein